MVFIEHNGMDRIKIKKLRKVVKTIFFWNILYILNVMVKVGVAEMKIVCITGGWVYV
jgi:hypothetical protein